MKRLIVCCDGTWQISSQKLPTNIALLSRAINPVSVHGNVHVEQVVYYQAGLGTGSNIISHLTGGIFGEGVSDNVRDAYLYICLNWNKTDGIADEIYLFGFSRGAYIARATAGLVAQFGLLTKHAMDGFRTLYDHYIKNKFKVTPEFLKTFDETYPDGRDANIKIKFIGVWDTVGSLGTPDLYIFGWKPWLLNTLLQFTSAPHKFGNTDLLPNVDFAFQALALNEARAPYSPTLWTKEIDNDQVLKQVWFPGIHTSIGGGNAVYSISDITLAWMVQKLKNHTDLQCDQTYLENGIKGRGVQLFGPNDLSIPWGNGTWKVNHDLAYWLGGTKARTPGNYHPPADRETCEYVHKSTRQRIERGDYKGPDVSHLHEDDSHDDIEEKMKW